MHLLFWKSYPFLLAALFLLVFSAIPTLLVYAHDGDGSIDPESLDYTQKPGSQVPLDASFRSESGGPVQLAQLFSGKPVVLILAYYNCPTLCGIALEDLARAVEGAHLPLGEAFQVVTVSIDPEETPEHAAGKKLELRRFITEPESLDSGWTFLTGAHAEIDRLAEAVGFEYAYDLETGEFLHPTGVVVLTPEGTVSRYITGIGYDPNSLRLGIVEASGGKVGGISDQVRLLCYRYDEQTARYTLALTRLIQAGSLGMVGVTAAAILYLERKRRRQGRDG